MYEIGIEVPHRAKGASELPQSPCSHVIHEMAAVEGFAAKGGMARGEQPEGDPVPQESRQFVDVIAHAAGDVGEGSGDQKDFQALPPLLGDRPSLQAK